MSNRIDLSTTLSERIGIMLAAYARQGVTDGIYGTVRRDEHGALTIQADGLDALIQLHCDRYGWHARLNRGETIAHDPMQAIRRVLHDHDIWT
ncbi:hypothetical protein [Marinivivus vitaminiproducens]|uniref:hypothetical protein n=1 Tax=Marinivivus vitaminiproducens TaxID=3035935 RepID=UPI00279E4BDB|nr:hypothetical protein P4R82_23595 [Geminicoccaceae bacterium SCSIO 64248]WGF90919.1 hypothetical protein P4R82_24250 [Geminicoccaceae bacterium SCSIO 64248]